MKDLLAQLSRSSKTLDLGCGPGSFAYEEAPGHVVGLDEWVTDPTEAQIRMAGGRVHYTLGSGVHLPFGDDSMDLVVANHVFEHVPDPEATATEVGRVLKDDGILFASIPDGYSFSDGLYRWCTGGGGHIQRYTFDDFQRIVETDTGLELLYAQPLYHGFTYLRPTPEKAGSLPLGYRLFARTPSFLRRWIAGSTNRLLRSADAALGTRLSIYGWAFYFGKPGAHLSTVPRETFINICAACGTGHSASWLESEEQVRGHLLRSYPCAICGEANPYFGKEYLHRILRHAGKERERIIRPLKASPASGISSCEDLLCGSSDFSPGSLVLLKRTDLARAAGESDGDQWPTELAKTRVLVNGDPAPLKSVEPDQILFQMPFSTARGTATVQVQLEGSTAVSWEVEVSLTSPTLPSIDGTGAGRGKFAHWSWQPVSLEEPALPGETITTWATGLGPVAPFVEAGLPGPVEPPATTTRNVFATVGGRDAIVEFCGLAPGVIGYYQVNVRVPDDLPPGEHEAFIEIGGARSNVVTIPVGA